MSYDCYVVEIKSRSSNMHFSLANPLTSNYLRNCEVSGVVVNFLMEFLTNFS